MLQSPRWARTGPSEAGQPQAGRDARPRRRRTLLRTLLVVAVATAALAAVFAGGAAGATPSDAVQADDEEFDVELEAEYEEPYVDELVRLNAIATGRQVDSYTWEVSDGTDPDTDAGLTYHRFQEPGPTEVTVTAVSENDTTATATVNVTVVEPEPAAARIHSTKSDVVVDEPIWFESYLVEGLRDHHRIDYGDGTRVDDPAVGEVHAYEEPGTYTANYTVETLGGETVVDTHNVTVRAQNESEHVAAAFELTEPDPEAGTWLEFDAGPSEGDPTEYWWFWGDGYYGSASVPWTRHHFNHDGHYDVTLTVVGENATDTTTREITVGDPPAELPNASLRIDPANPSTGEALELNATPSAGAIVDYDWTVDGQAEYGRTTSYTFDEPGSYDVELTVENVDGETDSTNATVNVSGASLDPELRTDGDDHEVGEPVRFTAANAPGNASEYWWRFGDGTSTSTNESVVEHQYDEAGTYDVELVVTETDGDTASTKRTIEVAEPSPPYAEIDTVRVNHEVGTVVDFRVDDPVGNVTEYRWDFGDGTTRNGTDSPDHRYTEPDEYRVELTVVGDDGETTTVTETVEIRDAELEARIDRWSPARYTGTSSYFDADDSAGRIASYHWAFGDGATLETNDTLVSHTYQEPGTYEVELTVRGVDGETDTETTTIRIVENGEVAAVPDRPDGNESQGARLSVSALESLGDIVAYRWTLPDDRTATFANEHASPSHRFTEPGSYTVDLTVLGADGETDTASVTVPVEEASLSESSSVWVTDEEPVVGQPVGVSLGHTRGPIESIRFDFGDGTTVNESGGYTSHTYESAGTYEVEATFVGTNGETYVTNETVTVSEQDASASIDARLNASTRTAPVGEWIDFDGSASADSVDEYAFQFEDEVVRSPYGRTSSYFQEPGTHEVTLIVASEAAVDRTSVEVEVVPRDEDVLPALTANDTSPTVGESVTLDAWGTGTNVTEYRWAFGDDTTATTEEPRLEHAYDEPGEYEATVTLVDGRENATANVSVTVTEPEPCADAAGGSAEVAGQTVCDVNGDGHFRDVNANGEVAQDDVVAFFEHQHVEAWKQPELFDFSGNDRVNHFDVVELFEYTLVH